VSHAVSVFQKRGELLPNSAYAEELQRSAGQMRFPPELEGRYRAFYLAERRTHVRSFHVILAILTTAVWVGGFLLVDEPQNGFSHWRIAGIAITYFALAYLAYSPYFERLYLGLAPYGCMLISVAGAFEVAHQMALGRGELFAVLTTWSLGLYYLCGILFSSALLANLVLLVSFGVAMSLSGEPAAHVAYLISFLSGVAAIGGIAFRNQGSRFRRSFLANCFVAELAARDGLTGLKNRRAFDEHLVRTWQQALRDRRRLVVFMIDVDHFKRFNDRYGHQLGDTALQRIAATVNEVAGRPLDMAARYGGEEFAVIFYDMPPDHAEDLAERLRVAVQELRIEHADSSVGVATVSIGVAVVRPTLERSPEGAVQLADEALYQSKASGRNRATIFDKEYDGLATGTFRATSSSA
jgi:diguanylate cyclase (GGDEF)-like protein